MKNLTGASQLAGKGGRHTCFQIEQGDVLRVEKIKGYVLVVSKNFFNLSKSTFMCPIVAEAFPDPLHISIATESLNGVVLCEDVKRLDLRERGFKKVDRIKYDDIINITDAIQSIFDY
jgi:mRNA-degrading endonuclease toxin of MazEF toxin-antitoxin module